MSNMSECDKSTKVPLGESIAHAHSFSFVLDDGSEIPAHRHKNPDGSLGGWVAATAVVDPTSVIDETAFVWPNAVVGPHEIVRGHCFSESQHQKMSLE